ncbi:hypothetical protein [Rheinheimera soli]|uniref:Uncharacterized protein YcfL n=1 Tax=Rheinheimera soli TaxID=443616 RepID=A0ABU1W0Z5_9GAMM|nr:hypothetical protein [Rheinheimera soli]MDR7121639.1 uncharacterized protein YcfL [Rheinheimera soli]
MKNLIWTLAAAVVLTACASTSKQEVVQKDDEVIKAKEAQVARVDSDGKVCEHNRSTGSMLKNKRCRTKAQIEAEREEARDTMNRIQSNVTGLGEMHRQ